MEEGKDLQILKEAVGGSWKCVGLPQRLKEAPYAVKAQSTGMRGISSTTAVHHEAWHFRYSRSWAD